MSPIELKSLKNPTIKFELLRMAPEFTNSVLVSCGDKCVIFDAWGRAGDWMDLLHKRGLNLDSIFSTHGHPDHNSGASDLAVDTGATWYMNQKDFDLLGWGDWLLNEFGLPSIKTNVVPTALLDGSIYVFPNLTMDVILMSGHTCGGVGFYFRDAGICIVGDTVFADSVGRTDFPGGDVHILMQFISNFYNLNLPDDTIIVPGHGDITTIAGLKQFNPWFKSL